MGKKKSKVNVEVEDNKSNGGEPPQKEKNEQDNNKDEEAAKNKDNKGLNVVLKLDLHCEGCASKVVKFIRGLDGVEGVKCDGDANKLTVVGDVDPAKLREKVEKKTHKKVELVSPVPKKENKEKTGDNNGEKQGNEQKKSKEKKKNGDDKKKGSGEDNKPSDEEKKKSKGLPVTTAVMKVHFHCDGCIQKIHKIVSKTTGYEEMKIDRQEELLTVKGAMDMKALAECLKKHLKKDVEIVPPKEGKKKEGGGGGGGGKKGKGGGDEQADNGGGGGGGEMEGNRMQVQFGYPYHVGGLDSFQFQYQYYYPYHAPAPQMFSDENPNACSVM